jgi:hypothetical protein
MAVRIVEQSRVVHGTQSAGNLLCQNLHVHGVEALHSATFESGNTAAIVRNRIR